MNKIYVLMDIDCIECGVGTKFIKSFIKREQADIACEKLSKETGNWRDGGQSIPEVFEVNIPIK